MTPDSDQLDVAPAPDLLRQADKRLARIEGQVRGLRRMVAEERKCVEILQQIASVQEALRGVSKVMMQRYLENCVTEGIRSDDPEERDDTYEDLLKVIYRFVR